MKTNLKTLMTIFCLSICQTPALLAQPQLPALRLKGSESQKTTPLAPTTDSLKSGMKIDSNSQPAPTREQSPEQLRRSIQIEQNQGGGSSNGGNVAQSDAVTRFLDMVREATEAPYDPNEQKAYETLKKMMANHRGFQTATIFQEYYGVSKAVDERVIEALDQLQFILVNCELPELNDRGMVTLNWNFKGIVKRLAIQHRESKTVLVDRHLLTELLKYDPKEQTDVAAFFLHEALIRVFYDRLIDAVLPSTEGISNIVTVTFGQDPLVPTLSAKSLAMMLNRTGIQTSPIAARGLKALRFMAQDTVKQNFDGIHVFFNKSGQIRFLTADAMINEGRFQSWNAKTKFEGQVFPARIVFISELVRQRLGAILDIRIDSPENLGGIYLWNSTANDFSLWHMNGYVPNKLRP